jgi:two-component system, chemotaxis family, chemotaxis protein CheY
MKVLVVEDSSTIKKIIKATIDSMGYSDILEASDGEEAMQIIGANSDIKLVITDKNMPNMDGVELARRIRSNDATSSILVVMITSESAKEDIDNALQIGVTDYIIKPVTQQALREKLTPVFESIKASQTN